MNNNLTSLSPVAINVPSMPGRRRLLTGSLIAGGFLLIVVVFSMRSPEISREEFLEIKIAEMQKKVSELETLYSVRYVELMHIQKQVLNWTVPSKDKQLKALKRKYKGSQVLQGFDPKNRESVQIPILLYIMPHIARDPRKMWPAFRIPSQKRYTEFVIGITTVRRYKVVYWLDTLKSLVDDMSPDDRNSALIVIYVGETDLSYVAEVAREIETIYPHFLGNLIEVISPSVGYYPEGNAVPPTLCDSALRVKWRSKHNLDAIFLMSYAQSRGMYFLMLEDDVDTKPFYLEKIRYKILDINMRQNWFMLDFSQRGNIGKLFKSSDLVHFITYLNLFYYTMPIDWLTRNYFIARFCPQSVNNEEVQDSIISYIPSNLTEINR